jgi:hypothetical protein
MTTISNETLMAFSDGELDAQAAEMVRAELGQNVDLQERLRRMQAVDELLRSSVRTDLGGTSRFSKLLADDASAEREGTVSNVVSMARPATAWKQWVPTGVGVAAAMLIVMGSSFMSPARMSWLEQVDDGIALAGPVLAMITTAPSGSSVQSDGLRMRPVVSFVSADGRLCREAQLDDDEMAARILVCRDVSENEWCIEAFARMPTLPNKSGYYAAAAGIPSDPVIDAAYARLGRKTILDQKGEKQAMELGWVQK